MPRGVLRAALLRAIAALQHVVQALDTSAEEAEALELADEFELVGAAVDEPEPVGERAERDRPPAADPVLRPRPPAPTWNERCAHARALGQHCLSLLRGETVPELQRVPLRLPAARYYLLVRNSGGQVYSPVRAYQRLRDLERELERHSGPYKVLSYKFASQREAHAFGEGALVAVAFNRFQ